MGRLWALRACLTLSFTPFGRSCCVTHADDRHHHVGQLVDHLVNLNHVVKIVGHLFNTAIN